jgi:hypothetical protein
MNSVTFSLGPGHWAPFIASVNNWHSLTRLSPLSRDDAVPALFFYHGHRKGHLLRSLNNSIYMALDFISSTKKKKKKKKNYS